MVAAIQSENLTVSHELQVTKQPIQVAIIFQNYCVFFLLIIDKKIRKNTKLCENSTERKFHRTFVPGSEKAWEQKGQGARRPGSERAKERKFQGANWPGSYWPIRTGERIGPGTKRLDTIGKSTQLDIIIIIIIKCIYIAQNRVMQLMR